MTDTEALRELTRLIFVAGNTEKSVAQRWSAFEEAFQGFDPAAVAALGPDAITTLHANPGLIRHRSKLAAVLSNARTFVRLSEVYESFAAIVDALKAESYERRSAFFQSTFCQVGPLTAYKFLLFLGLAEESNNPYNLEAGS